MIVLQNDNKELTHGGWFHVIIRNQSWRRNRVDDYEWLLPVGVVVLKHRVAVPAFL